jgi:homoserine kinase
VPAFRAYAPATIGNLAAGFDVLGAALAPVDGSLWGDVVEAERAESDSFIAQGPHASSLPEPRENLVPRARALLRERLGGALPPLRLTLYKGLPLRSGLGSSSASIVAALVACEAAGSRRLDKTELLALAGQAEATAAGVPHLDNVASCLLGGLTLVTGVGMPRALPFPEDLRLVVVHPDLELSTAEARAVLPRDVPLELAVEHAGNLASLVHALHAGDRELLSDSLRDLLAEPHRAGLVRGFHDVKRAALELGALGASFSGAGPALFAVADVGRALDVADAMRAAFAEAGVAAEARVCWLDPLGARLL